jgi:hypothetical protein
MKSLKLLVRVLLGITSLVLLSACGAMHISYDIENSVKQTNFDNNEIAEVKKEFEKIQKMIVSAKQQGVKDFLPIMLALEKENFKYFKFVQVFRPLVPNSLKKYKTDEPYTTRIKSKTPINLSRIAIMGMPKNGKNMHYGRNMKNGPGMPLGRMLTPDAFLLWNPDEPLPFFNRTNTTEQNMNLNIYPNPASGQVQFSVEPEQETTIGFRIFDKDGNEVLSVDPENTPAGLYSVTIDVSSLTNGLYIVKATSGQMSAIGRLIVKH